MLYEHDSPTFYFGMPPSRDPMWLAEMDSVADYCQGCGLDPGAGGRTFSDEVVRCDIRPERKPHVISDAVCLPFRDAAFDFVVNAHLVEHILHPLDAIREWIRVVKVGGYVCMVIPDTRFTGAQNTDATPHRHEWSPVEFLRLVCGWDKRGKCWWEAEGAVNGVDAVIVEAKTAGPGWSFATILQRTA